jgi:hypothetical protein
MQPRPEDNHIIDSLTVTLGRKNLGMEEQPPEKGMHGFWLIRGGLPFNTDRVGIRHGNLIGGAAGQGKKPSHAGCGTPRPKISVYGWDCLVAELHIALLMVLLVEALYILWHRCSAWGAGNQMGKMGKRMPFLRKCPWERSTPAQSQTAVQYLDHNVAVKPRF